MDKRTTNSREKKKLEDHLQLLNDGRQHYLEFLRNLGPQTILLTMFLYVAGRLVAGDAKEPWVGYLTAITLLVGYLTSGLRKHHTFLWTMLSRLQSMDGKGASCSRLGWYYRFWDDPEDTI